METLCSDDEYNKSVILVISSLSTGSVMYIATILFWMSRICKYKSSRLRAKPKTSATSDNNQWCLQVTRNKSQGPSFQQRIWRKQSFLNETSQVQPVRLPRPVVTGKDLNNRHGITSRDNETNGFDFSCY